MFNNFLTPHRHAAEAARTVQGLVERARVPAAGRTAGRSYHSKTAGEIGVRVTARGRHLAPADDLGLLGQGARPQSAEQLLRSGGPCLVR